MKNELRVRHAEPSGLGTAICQRNYYSATVFPTREFGTNNW